MPEQSELPLFSTRAELAELLCVHERSLDRWVAEGRLKATRPGGGKAGRVLFHRRDVERFFKEAKQ